MSDQVARLRPRVMTLAVAVALGLSGCGGGGSNVRPTPSSPAPPITGGDSGDAALIIAAGTTLRVNGGDTVSNHIVLEQKAVLDNAGALGGAVDIAVEGKAGVQGTDATVLNHDGGTITATKTGVLLNAIGTVRNARGGVIQGDGVGVELADGGLVSNDGVGSIIRSSAGIAIRISGDSGVVENTAGATITAGATAIYLQHGGKVTNSSGSTIETTRAAAGDCGAAGTCSIFVSSGDISASTADGGLTLINAGTIIGNVQLIPVAYNDVSLSAGSSIRGDLRIGSNRRSSLSLNGDAGSVQLYSQAVTGSTTFAGSLDKSGDGTWIIDNNDLGAIATTIRGGTLQIGNGGTEGSIGGSDVAIARGRLLFNRSDAVNQDGAINGDGQLVQAGTGSLTLTGSNAYAGGTQVNSGRLYVDGDQSAATGATTVADGATLGGKGVLGGNVIVADGATLAPGRNGVIGTLTMNGDLGLSAGSILDFTFGQANAADGQFNDLINVNGNLILDGVLNVGVASVGSFGPGVYRIFNYAGTLLDNGLTVGTIPSTSLLVQTELAHQVNLINEDTALGFWDGNAGPKGNNSVDGGSGIWESGSSLTLDNWTDASGSVNAPFADRTFAVFQAMPGTVTVDDGNGAVSATGMQFASDGYVIRGDAIHLVGSASDPARSIIRVGDGTKAGAGYKATINTVLDGDSTLVKADAGTLILANTNTYTGGTAISSGTLQIGNGGMGGSIIGDVTNDGSLVFNRSGDPAFFGIFGGTISGKGSLVQAGSDKLILTGTNTYSGGTTVDGGTLQVGNYLAAGSIIGNVTNNGSLVFARQDDVDFNGTVSGTGTLVKSGEGVLTLSAANTYTGGTTVGGGTLRVASGATLGSGSISVGNYGAYYFANHILQIESGAVLSNQIVMGGYGTLNNAGYLGGTLEIAVGGSGALSTVLNHDGGSIAGNDSGVLINAFGTVRNSGAGVIQGGYVGVGLGGGGVVTNDGAGTIIRSSRGTAIRITGESGTVENTAGGTITSSSTPIYLQHGGTVVNGAGATIEAAGARGGDCESVGVCSIFVASGDSTASTTDGGLTLENAGSIIGSVQMIATAYNGATLHAGGSVHGDLLLGSNNGSLLKLDGGTGTVQLYSQAVTGKTTFEGLFFKNGGGTWIIDSDDLSAVTHTEINGGVLQVGNGGVQGSIGTATVQIASGGTLAFDHADDVLFTGSIGRLGSVGRASLVQAGTGALTLAEIRAFDAFDITVERGVLQFGVGQLGSISATNLNVVDNGSLVFDFDGQSLFQSPISGTGSLTKRGPGMLTLGLGSSSYTGGTMVESGTLLAMDFLRGNVVVNPGAVLQGAATDGSPFGLRNTIGNLSNGGTVVVSKGNAVVVGDYSQASTGTLAVSLGSKLAVDGTATLNGGILKVTGADSGYTSNAHTEVLTARDGVSGTFGQLVKGTGVVFTATTINYDANSVWLDTTGLNVTTSAAGGGVTYTPASMGSARRVQGAFEQLNSELASGDLASVSGDFLHAAGQFQQSPTLQAAQVSLQSLSGELHAASAAMTFRSIDASSRALSDRFDDVLDRRADLGIWTRNLSASGDMASTGYGGVSFQLNGWLVGSDHQIDQSGVAGFAFGQSRGQQRLDRGYDHDDGRSTEGMLYAGWFKGNWYMQGRVGLGRFQQDVSRQILLGYGAHGVWTQYNGRYDVAYGESGLHFDYANSRVTPFIDVEYARINRDGFAEQGAGGFGLRGNARALDRSQAGIGVRADHRWELAGGRALDVSARAQWQHTLALHGSEFDASFVGLQQWQPVMGVGMSRYSGVLGITVDATLSSRTTMKFGYDYEAGERDTAQTFAAHINVAF